MWIPAQDLIDLNLVSHGILQPRIMKVVETWRFEVAILFQGHSPCFLYFWTYILCFDQLEIPQLAWVRWFR
jgi:hypothetical protein